MKLSHPVESGRGQQTVHTEERGEHKDSYQMWGTGLGTGISRPRSKESLNHKMVWVINDL